ncbi:MAG: DoxX family protein [Elusimicrobiota bacterium]|jgi:uncharacterized membrane protein YphA (DoxX/SURF4 family)|nr:DoxX family protein [Elusimicrobiota bacterium]
MISEKSLSAILFLQRIIFSSAFAFLAAGEALHINAFTQNAIDIGLPFARVICVSVVIITFVCVFCILFGLFFRTASFAILLISLFSGFFFFAGDLNKVNTVGVLFALTILCGFLFCGAGKISWDYYLRRRKELNNKRITFR